MVARGNRVKDFIESDDWKAARRVAQAHVVGRWKNAATVPEREAAHALMWALEGIEDVFAAMLQDGAVAQDTITRERKANDEAL